MYDPVHLPSWMIEDPLVVMTGRYLVGRVYEIRIEHSGVVYGDDDLIILWVAVAVSLMLVISYRC